MAVLHFIGELLRSSAPGCSAWDVVAHIFSEFSRASGRLVRAERDAQAAFRVPAVPRCRGCRWQRGAGRSRSSAALAWPCIHRAPRGLGRGSDGCFPPLSRRRRGSLCAVEAREERAVQRLCGHVLGTLDVSAGGVAKLLWPRLLRHVVPAQHAGMLVPLCRCLCALAERQESAEREEEEVASEALEPVEQGREQKVLVRCARLGGIRAVRVPGTPCVGSACSHWGSRGWFLPCRSCLRRQPFSHGSPAGPVWRWRGRGPLQPRVGVWDVGHGVGKVRQGWASHTAFLSARSPSAGSPGPAGSPAGE
ncbi:uncharacterized protein [Struthio camelus]